jgi:L-alanine-DL-glutamate epimerase-like enolase superfamily enzyme
MKCSYQSFNLAFRHPFTISRGTKTHQPTLVVTLEQEGIRGWGEAPAISYYDIPIEKMIADLLAKKEELEQIALREPEGYWQQLHNLFPENSFLLCALDMAAWDLFGKGQKKPLFELWGLDPARGPLTDYTIGIDTPDKMIAKMKEKPWPIYKIKTGFPDDIGIIERLRAHTDAVFRVDANAGWSLKEALDKIPRLEKLGVEFIEQPLPKDDWEGMKTLYERSPLPLIADEACVKEADVAKCRGYFHGINIKLTKCGGITPARRMIGAARVAGLKLMVGSMNESSLGSAAIAHLLPELDFVDMDGPLLLKEDIATGLSIHEGRVIIPGDPGLGITYTGLFQRG